METQPPLQGQGTISGTLKGLYQQKRSSINMLIDPQVLGHLTGLYNDAAQQDSAKEDEERSRPSVEIDVREELIGQLKRNIAMYNARTGLGKFTVMHTERSCSPDWQSLFGELIDSLPCDVINNLFLKIIDVREELIGQLKRNIAMYNARTGLGKFTVMHTEGFNFEGTMRFYLENLGRHKSSSKAIKLTNQTDVKELMPILADKFNISKNDKKKKALYQVQERDEILLSPEECPLDIAVNSKRSSRFVMRLQKMEPPPPAPHPESGNVPPRQHKVLSRFFGVENSDLNAPFAPPSETTSTEDKPGERSPFRRQGTVGSISSNDSSGSTPRSDKTGMLGGLLLKNQTPKYRKRYNSEESKSDSGATPSMKRKSGKRRIRTTSLSNMLHRSISFKYDGKNSSKELSVEESTPGLLKVFGSHISPEAQYKSVLATRASCADGIIKEVLERYSLSRDSCQSYVLCDVIGNYQMAYESKKRPSVSQLTTMRDERVWVTDCVRILRDNEKPLELCDFWKPEEGYLRRFEIRKRSLVELRGETDTVTQGINSNAKRIQMAQSHANTIDIVPTSSDARFPSPSPEELEGGEDAKKALSTSSRTKRSSITEVSDTRSSTPDARRRTSEREETESSDEPTAMYNLGAPRDCPYLLTLKGRDPEMDLILYLLHQQVCLIGSRHDSDAAEHLVVDITFEAPDILPHHCWIFQRQVSNSPNMDECVYNISIEPISDAPVTVNGALISSNTGLTSGDIICIGRHYMFMFKDPASEQQRDVEIEHLRAARAPHEGAAHLDNRLEPSQPAVCEPSLNTWVAPSAYVGKKAQEYHSDYNRLKLVYPKDQEDTILDYIAFMQQAKDGRGFGLAPAYVLAMCVEHAAFSYCQEHTKALVIRAAALVHSLAWDKTKELASKQPKKLNDVHKVLRTLLPHLRNIVFWMANALELLHFFCSNMRNYIGNSSGRTESVDETGAAPSVMSSIQDEISAELEEVVMYTFQQTVYYLTKTLYISLPNILDTNPFLDDEDKGQDDRSPGMEEVIHVFQTTFDMLYGLDVHPQITSQLFAYLLFFTNASLFNMLMERGSTGNLYKWSKGAQIRGNLDILETWLQDHGLTEQLHFLSRVSMAVNLLATPKLQLMQADWSSLRHDFPSLSAAQVQQLLSKYQLGTNQARPTGWFPPRDQVEAAMRTEDILERFDNHPPLVLPNAHFKLDLQRTPKDPSFRLQIQRLCKTVPEVIAHFGQSAEHKLFSPRLTASFDNTKSRRERVAIPLESHLLPLNHSAPASPSCARDYTSDFTTDNHAEAFEALSLETPYESRPRKLSRVLEADAVFEDSDESARHHITMTHAISTPCLSVAQPPLISVTPPKSPENDISLIDSEPHVLLEPPLEFANGEDHYDKTSDVDDNEQEEVKHDGILKRTDSTDENENIPPPPGLRTDSHGSTRRLSIHSLGDDSPEGDRIRTKDRRRSSLVDMRRASINSLDDGGMVEGDHHHRGESHRRNSAVDMARMSIIALDDTMDESEQIRMKDRKDSLDDVFVVDLEKWQEGLGLGLIDGMHTPLRSPGIYVRKLVPNGSAVRDGRLKLGDRILAVNGNSLVGADYHSAMHLIRTAGEKLRFLVAKSEHSVTMKITSSSC